MVELLSKIGWSQAEFGRQVGVSANTVGRWCRNRSGLSYRLACLYLEALVRGMGK